MLIKTQLSDGDIVTIKLNNGAELIAKFFEETAHDYRVSKPMMLGASPDGLRLVQYIITVSLESTIAVNKSGVSAIELTASQFASMYIEASTSIII